MCIKITRRSAKLTKVFLIFHQANLTLYSLDKIIAGDKLDDVVTALMAEDQARRLAAMEEEG